ncbi:MAG: hypothetical protein ACR2NT_09995 [Acidimicrobiia bacterium]|nr:hypothetical protein [Acidimicrobiia bacterium]MDQ3500778.1 hypothetical protein [Actinomycetota bacterium]
MNPVVDNLVRDGILEIVPVDATAARQILEVAARHVDAARLIIEVDRSGAYVLCNDAARKAIAGILLASGYRALAVPGSHAAIARAAGSMSSDPNEVARLVQLDGMRRHRNRSEYGIRTFSAQEAEAAIELASWTIDFARRVIS